ncbi:hypothetical protein PR202_ga24288 [Eleusine coracana subsp. coracana]|uniref:Uncharacterized protein n=1 Tax=Eleusine coracana subsp. coracana TaxID=191504 RepID=A0AAV5D937_ELECO|nr:hypothetical protein PR202_ga24288 [Eleusine coracana subsp. coracana]
MGTLPYSNLVAIQLTDSWASTPVRGVLTKDSSASEDGKLFCEFSKDLSEEGLNSLGYRKRPETDVDEDLSQSVVSLASFTGIIIKWSGCTTILTSASLIRNPVDEKKIIENLRVGARKVSAFLFAYKWETDWVAEHVKAGIGGPAVDLEGKFVGMNFYDWKDGTPFLPQFMIVQVLAHFEKERYVWIVEEVDEYDGPCPSHCGVILSTAIRITRRKKSLKFQYLAPHTWKDMDTSWVT